MKRHFFHVLLAVSIGIIAFNTAVVGQDKVERRDRKTDKSVTVAGKILEEKMEGVKMKVGAKEETIPAGDIVRIYYDDIPLTAKAANLTLFNNEEKEKDPAKLLKEFQDLQLKVKDSPPAVRRYFDFRITMLKAALAEKDDDKAQAILGLQTFASANNTFWEYPLAARTLARMQLEKSDFEQALKTLEPLTKSAAVPADIKAEAENMLIDALFQANKIDQVKAKIDAALANPATNETQKARFAIYKIGLEAQAPEAKIEDVVKKLDDIIAKPNTDNGIKALAYNIMGDCYSLKGRKRDAMWSYLWVDVVFSQDKGEHLKAMAKLLKLFEEEKDTEKVQIYKDKIARSK